MPVGGNLSDDPQSLSFGSSGRSASDATVSTSSASTSTGDSRRRPTSTTIVLSDIRFLRRLGSGDIGSVYLALLKCAGAEDRMLAAKVMDRKELAGRNKEGRAKTEREILEMLDHPFLPKLIGVSDNDKWSCLLTEFCPGGDLHLLRQRQPNKRFPESAVRFFASEVVVALEYLHMLGIIYRDLKPENVLIRSDGHIMLTDFDLSLKVNNECTATPAHVISDNNPLPYHHSSNATTASCILPSCIVPAVTCFQKKKKHNSKKKTTCKNPNGPRGLDIEFVAEPVDARSMSFVGTHEYLAPEIISGEGHGSSVDWWTLGVLVFELLYGFTPFRGVDNELTLANIVARALEFPKEPNYVSPSVKDFISSLLVKDPTGRMGSTTGASAVKRHPFFNGVNWALLRCASPPHVPPPFQLPPATTGEDSGRDHMSVDSCPGTPVDYY